MDSQIKNRNCFCNKIVFSTNCSWVEHKILLLLAFLLQQQQQSQQTINLSKMLS